MQLMMLLPVLLVSAFSWAEPALDVRPERTESVWIWGAGETESASERRYFRGTVEFPEAPRQAILLISADTRYFLWINGVYVAEGPVRGGPGDPPMDRHEVGKLMRAGPNSISVLVHHIGGNIWRHSGGKGGLLVQVDSEKEGHRRSFVTSEKWKTKEASEWGRDVPDIGGGAGYFEAYDARKAVPVSWSATWFDDSAWDRAEPANPPSFPVPAYSIRTGDVSRIFPEKKWRSGVIVDRPEGESAESDKSVFTFYGMGSFSVVPGRPGENPFVVYDFGGIVAGTPRIELDGGDGAVVEVAYSGDAGDGSGTQKSRDRCDRYTCRGGLQKWGPMGTRGFRFVRLKFRSLPAPVKCRFWVEGIKEPVKNTGTFHCSDPRLNEVWRACVRTINLCVFDLLVDDPIRQAVSAPDAISAATAGYVLWAGRDIQQRTLRVIGETIGMDGYVSGEYPQILREQADENGLLWTIALADYFNWSGDRAFISGMFPSVKLALSWYASRLSADGLLSYSPSRSWIDDAERRGGNEMKKDCDGSSSALNSLYAAALDSAAFLAEQAGEGEDTGKWRDGAAAVRRALNASLWNADGGYFYDCVSHDIPAGNISQQSNILGALYGGMPPERAGKLLGRIGAMGEADHAEWALVGTPYFGRFYLEALAANGRAAEAIRMVKRRWGGMLADGARTFGEKWSARTGYSACNSRSAHPAYFLVTRVLGITPGKPGMSRARISPVMGGLDYASGTVPTPFGTLETGWKRRGKGISVEVACPPEMDAVVELPTSGIIRPVLSVSGKRVWKEGQPAPDGITVEKGMVKVLVAKGGRARVELF